MISLASARDLIVERLLPRPAVRVPLTAARGRVLAEPVLADASYPSGDRSMMDGYALAAEATAGRFRIVGEVQAGQTPAFCLGPGEAARIFTGALLPAGAGRVVMQEQAQREGDWVSFSHMPDRRLVRPAGSEARQGAVVLPAGTRLGAAELAILAQVGAISPRVTGPVSIRHLVTGNELVAPAETPSAGQIRDTNSALLAALFADFAGVDVTQVRGFDDPDELAAAAGTSADLLVISGGASVGDYDFGAATLRRLGFTIHFDQVNLRPGKPLTFATRASDAAFVLPGNPVSHFVCFTVALRLALERLTGQPPRWSFLTLSLAGGESLRPDPRETFWPARAEARADKLQVTPLRWSTSGDTFSLAGTNALIRLPAGQPIADQVETLLLDVP